MLSQALQFVLETVFELFLFVVLLRFFMQWARAPFRNPVGHFVTAFTDFAVKPLRRVIPGWGGLDLATLLLAWFTAALMILLIALVNGFPASHLGSALPGIALLALVKLLRLFVYLVIGVVLVQAILSWVNPYSPIGPLLNALSGPFLRPLRRFVPPIGNVDLTPLVVLVVAQLILMLPVLWLESLARALVQ